MSRVAGALPGARTWLVSTFILLAVPLMSWPTSSSGGTSTVVHSSDAAAFRPAALVPAAAPSIFYVDGATGSDSNPGTQALPWRTIQKAANTLMPGQTVVVLAGTYNERVQVTTSGASGLPIDYEAQGSVVMHGFTVQANYITIKGFEITDTPDDPRDGIGIWVQGSYCDLENNYIHFATRGGIRLYVDYGRDGETSHCVVRHNKLYRNSQWGIEVMGSNNLIEDNDISASIQYHPAWINPPSWVDADGMRFSGYGHIIRGNYIHDISYSDPYNVDPHIDCFQTWAGSDFEAGHDIVFARNYCINLEWKNRGGRGFELQEAANLLLRNNVIRAYNPVHAEYGSGLTIVNNTMTYDLQLYSGGLPEGVQLSNTPGSVIKNNIFYDFMGYAIDVTDAASAVGLDAGHNLIFRSDGAALDGTPYPGDLWDVNPLFVDPATPNYHLQAGSPAVDAGVTLATVTTDFDGVTRPQGANYDIGAYEVPGNVAVRVGGRQVGRYIIAPSRARVASYAGIDNGAVKIAATGTSIVASERVIYAPYGAGSNTSFSEMMGLPNGQLDTTYWMPWYNNVGLNTQIRFGNISASTATVHVFIAGAEMPGSPFTLAAGASTRASFAGVDRGPVEITSNVDIVASERVIYASHGNGSNSSFSEMLGLPNSQLDTTYWFPWYNNVDLDTQLRIGNVSGLPATVSVFIGGSEVAGSPFSLPVGGSTRVRFAGVNNGPVKVMSNVDIVASERVIYNPTGTKIQSSSEMMGLPNGQLDTTYWMPWYNNGGLNTQIRFGNVSGSTATVHVFVAGAEMPGSPFTLAAGASTRVSFAGINNGPVKVMSDVDIIAAERLLYAPYGAGSNTSFSEMMALPNGQLDTTYWMPWYNNVALNSQLRFGRP